GEMMEVPGALRDGDRQKRRLEGGGGEGICGKADGRSGFVQGGGYGHPGYEGPEGISQLAIILLAHGRSSAVSPLRASQPRSASFTTSGAVRLTMWRCPSITSASPRFAV